MVTENWVILNFDLGIKGDYESLYRYLDNINALDCGNSNAVFQFNFSKENLSYSEKLDEIKKSLESSITFKNGNRIYCIVHNQKGIPRGAFLFGHRQRPIWEGYGNKTKDDDLPF